MLKIDKKNALKLMTIVCVVCLVMAMAVCFATETTPPYASLVTQLETGLGANAFTTVLGTVLPYIIAVTIVALVWYLIRRAIKKFSKGKPGV